MFYTDMIYEGTSICMFKVFGRLQRGVILDEAIQFCSFADELAETQEEEIEKSGIQ